MNLREARCLFSANICKLIQKINASGYEAAFGEVLRSDEQAAINALKEDGRAHLAQKLEEFPEFHTLAIAVSNNGKGNGILLSVHRLGLAVDLILYKDGVWCQDAKDYEQFGKWWEESHQLARWGGRFQDPAHFSFVWEGRK